MGESDGGGYLKWRVEMSPGVRRFEKAVRLASATIAVLAIFLSANQPAMHACAIAALVFAVISLLIGICCARTS